MPRLPLCWAGTDPSVLFLAPTLCPVKLAVLCPDPCVSGAGTGLMSHGQASDYLVSEKCLHLVRMGDGTGGLRQVQELRVGLYLL